MTRCLPSVSLALALALLVSPTPRAWAGAPTDHLKGNIDRVVEVLQDPKLKERPKDRRAEVRKIANETFDFSETAKRSLARHWQARTPAERDEFAQLFADVLERAYFSKIETYGGERIIYSGDSLDGDQAVVKTKLITKQETEIPIEYRMLTRGDKWLVYDVVIEGVSLIGNYRTQFNKIIQTSSYQELIRKMKAKDS